MRHLEVKAILVALLVGCGGTQPPADPPLTAGQHDREAERHEREAEEHEEGYDPYAAEGPEGTGAVYGRDRYNPTEPQLHEAAEHREHAAEHRARAEQLREFANIACGHFPAETRTSCPLLLGYDEVEDVDGGMRIVFPQDVHREAAAEHIRCHIAFVETYGRTGVDHCALYVPGITLRTEGDAILLVTSDAGSVEDLRRRVRLQTE